jgi:hypothetical protein
LSDGEGRCEGEGWDEQGGKGDEMHGRSRKW